MNEEENPRWMKERRYGFFAMFGHGVFLKSKTPGKTLYKGEKYQVRAL